MGAAFVVLFATSAGFRSRPPKRPLTLQPNAKLAEHPAFAFSFASCASSVSFTSFSLLLASVPPCLYPPNVPFRTNAQKIATDEDLYAAALRALMRRAYSVHEMKEYLGRRAADQSGVTVVITHLREQGYLDDAKYARDYARLHANSRRQGKFRITRELRTRGVPDRHIDAALESVFAETDETALVRERIKRKLGQFRSSTGRISAGKSSAGKSIDQKKIASLYRSLIAAGFSADVIRTEIRNVTKTDTADLADEPSVEEP